MTQMEDSRNTSDSVLADFAASIADPARVPAAGEVAFLESAYPYFTLPAAVRLARATDIGADERTRLKQRVATSSPDAHTLFRLIDPQGRMFADVYPPAENDGPSTDDAITTFLETYGHADPAEDALLERLIFNPVPEYAATLKVDAQQGAPADAPAAEKDSGAQPSGQDALLDAFLEKFPSETPPAAASAESPTSSQPKQKHKIKPTAPPDSLLSESLAKIYIARGRYDKAYDIIHNLSLNFPKKSIYFADQLRFLQKLILNSKYKKE